VTTTALADVESGRHAHLAAFYDSQRQLAVRVADFLEPVLTGDGVAIVIASPDDHRAFDVALRNHGVVPDPDRHVRLDADEALDHLMREGVPDRRQWMALLGGAIGPHVDAGRRVHIVAVIAEQMQDRGELGAAILVERLAEELAEELPFSLLCCYRTALFEGAQDQLDALRSICDVHAGLIYSDLRGRDGDGATVGDGAVEASPSEAAHDTLAALLHEQSVARAVELEGLRRERDVLRAELVRLAELEDAQQRFTAMVIHDIRTPTSVIAGLTGVLQNRLDELGPERVQDFLATVVRNADRIERLLDDILTVARLESQGFRYELGAVDLAVVAREACDQIETATGRTVDLRITDDLPPVRADTDRQLQILHNLLTNAAKFSGSGSPIEVALRAQGDEVVVTVRDEGRGIAAEDLDKLFQPFARLEHRAVDKVGGTGLGLYVTRLLVEGQGGRIEVSSVPGAGTTVTYTVPRA
jgi:signal transduction histidine kinase